MIIRCGKGIHERANKVSNAVCKNGPITSLFWVCTNVNQEQTNNVIIIGVEKGIQERANYVTFRCAKRITGMGQ